MTIQCDTYTYHTFLTVLQPWPGDTQFPRACDKLHRQMIQNYFQETNENSATWLGFCWHVNHVSASICLDTPHITTPHFPFAKRSQFRGQLNTFFEIILITDEVHKFSISSDNRKPLLAKIWRTTFCLCLDCLLRDQAKGFQELGLCQACDELYQVDDVIKTTRNAWNFTKFMPTKTENTAVIGWNVW